MYKETEEDFCLQQIAMKLFSFLAFFHFENSEEHRREEK